jgi:hypothetical protein
VPSFEQGSATTAACARLPSHDALRSALANARGQDNGGFDLDMWGSIVNRDGIVCAVAFTGTDRGRQWPGSRVIAAQKANTANLWAAVQPGGSLYGLQHSNPVSTTKSRRSVRAYLRRASSGGAVRGGQRTPSLVSSF